jgi:hypothetical protein
MPASVLTEVTIQTTPAPNSSSDPLGPRPRLDSVRESQRRSITCAWSSSRSSAAPGFTRVESARGSTTGMAIRVARARADGRDDRVKDLVGPGRGGARRMGPAVCRHGRQEYDRSIDPDPPSTNLNQRPMRPTRVLFGF